MFLTPYTSCGCVETDAKPKRLMMMKMMMNMMTFPPHRNFVRTLHWVSKRHLYKVSEIIEKCGEKMILRFFVESANKIGHFRYKLAR